MRIDADFATAPEAIVGARHRAHQLDFWRQFTNLIERVPWLAILERPGSAVGATEGAFFVAEELASARLSGARHS